MGLSCSAIHVRFDSPKAVADALRDDVRDRAFVSDSLRGWISVYDSASEQDFEEGKRVAAKLGARFQALVLLLDLYDEGVTRYALFENGELVDEFNSCPDYFGPGSSPAAAGNARVLERYGKAGNKLKLYESLLTPADFAVLSEEDRLRGIARCLGVAAPRALLSCSSLSPTREKNLIAVHARGNAAGAMELVTAARTGDVATVGDLLTRGIPADSKDNDGCTALERAVESKQPLVLELLLERPLPSRALSSALFWAAVRQDIGAARSLLRAGADVNSQDDNGRSPLFAAVYHPKAETEVARLLLDSGADPTAKLLVRHIGFEPRLTTPLHGAASVAPVAVVELLAVTSPTLEVTDAAGKTPLMVATERRRLDVVAVLMRTGSRA